MPLLASWRRALRLGCLLLGLLVAASPALAQTAQEQDLKAAYLYKFPAFVEWPSNARRDSPFVIALYGAEEVGAELQRLVQGRSLEGRPIEVRQLRESDAPTGAQLVFVGRDSAKLPAITRTLAGTPTLIVSESPGALAQGSMINFVVVEDRVRFEIAPESAARAGLRVSSRLLGVAQKVGMGR